MSDPAPDPAQPRHNWWQAVVEDDEGRRERLVLVSSGRHPDGSRVVMTAEDVSLLDDLLVCEAVFHGGTVTALHVSDEFAPRAPLVWFAEVRPEDAPEATDLLAFAGPDRAPGQLVSGSGLERLPVQSADQVAAARWLPLTGELDQVYVQPDRRRRHLGSLMVAAVACLNVARDRPRLWADGERTELGELLRNARSWRSRTADLTHVAPPMTPGDRPVP